MLLALFDCVRLLPNCVFCCCSLMASKLGTVEEAVQDKQCGLESQLHQKPVAAAHKYPVYIIICNC